MTKKLQITRNSEASELVAHIRGDAAMMSALETALHEFWQQYKTEFAAAGRSSWDPSPMLVPPTTDLIIALIERKVATLRAAPEFRRAATDLDALSKKASLYAVADEILQACLPEYKPLCETGQFELIDETTRTNKPWWQFW
jgi:hypothetical protein